MTTVAALASRQMFNDLRVTTASTYDAENTADTIAIEPPQSHWSGQDQALPVPALRAT